MSASKLLNALKSDTGLVTAVSNRILLAPANQGTKTPFVTYEFTADDPVRDLSGIATLQRQEWEITVTSERFSSAEQVKALVLRSLDNSTEFQSGFLSSNYEYDQEADIHLYTVSFLITY